MEILILVLSVICIVLLIVVIALVNRNKPQQNNDAQLIGQKIDMSSKHTSDQIVNLTAQMQELTEKNYQQQIKLMETLNVNAEKQTKAIGEAIASMQESNEKRLDEMRKPLTKS